METTTTTTTTTTSARSAAASCEEEDPATPPVPMDDHSDAQHQQHQHQHQPTATVVRDMLQACRHNDESTIANILQTHGLIYASQQDEATGRSPLMVAAQHGHVPLVQYLLDRQAPWNAVDRHGKCAGDYATDNSRWGIVQLLVDWGTRAELILGAMERSQRQEALLQKRRAEEDGSNKKAEESTTTTLPSGPAGNRLPVAEHQPSTKPDYLQQKLEYSEHCLLDQDRDAVMMEWERPLMKAHAQVLMGQQQYGTATTAASTATHPPPPRRRVLNVGFGMGIIDSYIQEMGNVWHHIIIEAHPDVYEKMKRDGWHTRPTVRVCFGTWQAVLPQLIQEGVVVDAIFYDTYGEHQLDMEDFHKSMVQILAKPHGVYSFFNGLAPDNLFFHGVACNVVKIQLSSLGLDSEFLNVQFEYNNDDDEERWSGIRRRYWHGRDTYYLPVCTWNAKFLQTGRPETTLDWATTAAAAAAAATMDQDDARKRKAEEAPPQAMEGDGDDRNCAKRQQDDSMVITS